MSTLQRPCALALACLQLLSGCTGERTADAAPPKRTAQISLAAAPAPRRDEVPYPCASWRLAEPSALAPVVIWFSQILIRHAEARAAVSFNLAYWSSVSTATRSRVAALELAQQVADQAARDPERFSELARQYSEDLPSRGEGGSRGGLSALQLRVWPRVLDALSALEPGQTSQVVETRYGFHIFYRSAPPREDDVSGEHVVIGHDQAPWLEVFARGNRPHRTRDEASALANDVYRQALAEPGRFDELVRRHSEHRDAIAGGDFGSWSTREPSAFAPRLMRLEQLAVGQVGTPIETHLGFEIIRRTASRPRAQYRAALLVFPVGEVGMGPPTVADPAVRANAARNAEGVAQLIGQDPSRFDQLNTEIRVAQWQEGRQNHDLTAVLANLRPGQITRAPVESEDGFILARRLEAEPVPPASFATELPEPTEPGLERFLASRPPAAVRSFLREAAVRASRELELSSAFVQRFEALHDLDTRLRDETAPEARLAAFAEMLDGTRALLGEATYARYRSRLSHDAAALLLPETLDPDAELGL
jgi:NIMA-interacting peptidyl-prolyl cis-trans isomerase 1